MQRLVAVWDGGGGKKKKGRLKEPDHEGPGCYFEKFRFYSVAFILAEERHNQMCMRFGVVKGVVTECWQRHKLGGIWR